MEQMLFENLPLSVVVLNAVAELGYTEMTPIQAQAIPLILEGSDVVGRSHTGTGKTAAFGLPIVEQLEKARPNHPQVLVLAPTRELALQISGEMRKYGKYKKSVNVTTIYGGDSYTAQMVGLRSANLVVGTPGRVMDHMERGTLLLDDVRTVVLDEADEMLDMGFVEDIRTILSATPADRQTLLFSATMPPAILKLTQDFQREPKLIAVDGGQRTLDSIEQFYYHIAPEQKPEACNLLLQRYGEDRALVFCNTRKMVDELTEYLAGCGFLVTGLHGEMMQAQRSKVMSDFKMGRIHVLIATDVAARGIDVEDVKAVINYDIPEDNEYYIHRIGRTGRAGRTGASHTLACSAMNIRRIKDLEYFLKMPIRRAYMPKPEEMYAMHREKMKQRVLENLNRPENDAWRDVAGELLAGSESPEKVLCALMQMASGSSGFKVPQVTDIVPQTVRRGESGRSDKGAKPRRELGADRVSLNLSIGRNAHIAPNFIVSAIVDGAGVSAGTIGKINIYADHSIVEVTPQTGKKILQNLQLTTIKGYRVRFSIASDNPKKNRTFAKKANQKDRKKK